jgi:hypothetical protein
MRCFSLRSYEAYEAMSEKSAEEPVGLKSDLQSHDRAFADPFFADPL